MGKESVRDKGGHVAWVFPDGTHVPISIAMNSSGNVVAPSSPGSTEAKQDDQISELQDIEENQTDGSQKTQIVDGLGAVVGSIHEALNVHVKDVHEVLVNRYLANYTGVTSDLNANADAGDIQIEVVSDTAFTALDYIHIKEGSVEEPNCFQVLTKPGGNILTIDRPLDNSYTTTTPATVEIVDVDLSNANGTLAAPISFKILPLPGITFHLLRMLWEIQDGTAMDTERFGGASALTNGCLVRVHKTGYPVFTMTNWKSNGDVMLDGFDFNFHDKAPAGLFGAVARISPYKVGAFVKLIGTNGDWAEILVQDNLTVLEAFQIKIQGHWDI